MLYSSSWDIDLAAFQIIRHRNNERLLYMAHLLSLKGHLVFPVKTIVIAVFLCMVAGCALGTDVCH